MSVVSCNVTLPVVFYINASSWRFGSVDSLMGMGTLNLREWTVQEWSDQITLRCSRRMPLLRVQTLLQHPVAVSDRSFVPHLVCAVIVVIGVSSKMVIQRWGWSHIQSATYNLSWAHFHRHLTHRPRKHVVRGVNWPPTFLSAGSINVVWPPTFSCINQWLVHVLWRQLTT